MTIQKKAIAIVFALLLATTATAQPIAIESPLEGLRAWLTSVVEVVAEMGGLLLPGGESEAGGLIAPGGGPAPTNGEECEPEDTACLEMGGYILPNG